MEIVAVASLLLGKPEINLECVVCEVILTLQSCFALQHLNEPSLSTYDLVCDFLPFILSMLILFKLGLHVNTGLAPTLHSNVKCVCLPVT